LIKKKIFVRKKIAASIIERHKKMIDHLILRGEFKGYSDFLITAIRDKLQKCADAGLLNEFKE
jgi:hypothetical protein